MLSRYEPNVSPFTFVVPLQPNYPSPASRALLRALKNICQPTLVTMVHSYFLLTASAILCLASAHGPELKRAPFEAAGIEPNAEGFGAPIAENEELASFAPPSLLGKKNSTMPVLKDRSVELVDRQTCGAGFGYCACTFVSFLSLLTGLLLRGSATTGTLHSIDRLSDTDS